MADRQLHIAITKSRLTGFSVNVKEDGELEFSCNLALCTEGGVPVTTVCHSTCAWQGKELKVPQSVYKLAGQLAGILHSATEDHVKDLQCLLESPSF